MYYRYFSFLGGYYIPPRPLQPQLPQQNMSSLNFNEYSDYNKDGTFLTYKYSSFPQGSPYQSPLIFTPPTYSHINNIWKR